MIYNRRSNAIAGAVHFFLFHSAQHHNVTTVASMQMEAAYATRATNKLPNKQANKIAHARASPTVQVPTFSC